MGCNPYVTQFSEVMSCMFEWFVNVAIKKVA